MNLNAVSRKSGRSFITLMLAIGISALLLRVALEEVVKFAISQNQSYAENSLRLIATALENYAKNHSGVFPQSLTELTQTVPAYIDSAYVSSPSMRGYSYSCPRMDSAGYRCVASPIRCSLSGKKVYAVTTGGLLVSEDCSGKE